MRLTYLIFDMELSSMCIVEPKCAVNQTGSTCYTELGCKLYFEPVVQLTWVGSKYSVEPCSILHVKPVVVFT